MDSNVWIDEELMKELSAFIDENQDSAGQLDKTDFLFAREVMMGMKGLFKHMFLTKNHNLYRLLFNFFITELIEHGRKVFPEDASQEAIDQATKPETVH